jgi:multidrug efflux system outer membrane protein
MSSRRGRWAAVGFLGVTLASGCAIGPDYKRPPVTPPEAFRSQLTPGETTSLADQPWWEAFGDPVLRNLIQEALGGNYNVRIAAARVQQARAQAAVARSPFFPQLGYNAAAAQSKGLQNFLGLGNSSSTDTVSTLYLGVATMSWEIDLWGKIRRSSEAATAQFLASEEARRAVLLSLVSDVAQAYFELLELDTRLSIARRSTAAYQDTFKLFQDRVQFGIASQLQTSRAEGNLAQAAASIPEIESQIAAKENQISLLLARNPGPVPRGRPLFDQAVTPTVPAGLPSALLERRPDLRRVEQELVAANARIGVAKSLFFPQLTLTGFLGKASPELSALTGGAATVWQAGGQLTGPIFQGGKIYQNYKASEALAEEAKWQYEQAVIQAFQEVSTSLAALEKLAGSEVEQARGVKALEKSVQISNDRYLYGLSSYFEILEAQQRLYPAQYTEAQIRLNRLLAYVQLYKALGGGWNLENPQQPPATTAAADRPACADADKKC